MAPIVAEGCGPTSSTRRSTRSDEPHPHHQLRAGVPHYVTEVERKGRSQAEDPLMQKIRYLDKLVDELARGKAVERVLRG
jgi:hypothetical protein